MSTPASGTVLLVGASRGLGLALGSSRRSPTSRESVPGVVDTITAAVGEPGLRFLDRRGETVPW